METRLYTPARPAVNMAAREALAPSMDLCARVDIVREVGAFSYVLPRPGQTVDQYGYHNMAEDGNQRYILDVHHGLVVKCSCLDHMSRKRACKHMALLAEMLIDERTVQAEELKTPTPAAPPAVSPRPYHSFPAGTELISEAGGYLPIKALAGTRQGGFFYLDSDADRGRRIETRKETMAEMQASVAAVRSQRVAVVDDALDASFWK